ncbi:hypothetical protein [Oceanirhabdus sp. W0125-5]|uniref:hypothetical protein n=1 Tax=Oceanirhabdus sp. W0125-5 TaxID=2999116 RepID=UPI0022F2B027|nr:hypothetical protein [Oceanirhabdus sp. W0125-5]WBW99587.1 hypothetical protein OW730_12810 [Oceanirhabdus sp. W0125-5]
MNMTKREKVMVMILSAVILMFLYSKFLLNPKQEKLQNLRDEKVKLEQKVKLLDHKGNRDKEILKLIEELKKEVNSLSLDIFNYIEEEDVIGIMDEIIDNSEITINNMSITPKTNEMITLNITEEVNDLDKSSIEQAYEKVIAFNKEEEVQEKNEVKESKNNKTKVVDVSSSKIGVTLSYKGTFNQLMKFISEIESFRKKIVIKNINIISGEMFELSGNIALEFYYLPISSNEEYMKFYPNADRNNPFVSKEQDSNEMNFLTTKADLDIMLKPTSSDIPTIYVKLSDDKDDSLVVFDSEEYENCKIIIKEKEEKYFIKYSVGNKSFPRIGYEMFTPNNEGLIKIEVNSTDRNSDKDTNGINLIIENETELPVKVKVISDDKKRPRCIITDVVGKVELE